MTEKELIDASVVYVKMKNNVVNRLNLFQDCIVNKPDYILKREYKDKLSYVTINSIIKYCKGKYFAGETIYEKACVAFTSKNKLFSKQLEIINFMLQGYKLSDLKNINLEYNYTKQSLRTTYYYLKNLMRKKGIK